jgi:DNA-binding NarL/FixJ family response regulator
MHATQPLRETQPPEALRPARRLLDLPAEVSMIRVALAEEQRIARWALREALGNDPELEIVAEAGTVAETIEIARESRPDVLVLDTNLDDHAGFDLLAKLRQVEDRPIVVLGARSEPSYAARAISAGAIGYVSKDEPPERLLAAIRAASRGEQVVPPGVAELLAVGEVHPAGALTGREQQVMEMLARGMTNREIALALAISIKTVDTHRSHILKKLGVRNNSELTRFALKHGYATI